jgi:serine/threonine-protein kinase
LRIGRPSLVRGPSLGAALPTRGAGSGVERAGDGVGDGIAPEPAAAGGAAPAGDRAWGAAGAPAAEAGAAGAGVGAGTAIFTWGAGGTAGAAAGCGGAKTPFGADDGWAVKMYWQRLHWTGAPPGGSTFSSSS